MIKLKRLPKVQRVSLQDRKSTNVFLAAALLNSICPFFFTGVVVGVWEYGDSHSLPDRLGPAYDKKVAACVALVGGYVTGCLIFMQMCKYTLL